jgi:hypothetical protein
MTTEIKANWDGIDPARSRLRLLVARVDDELAKVEGDRAQALVGLSGAWAKLVGELALGDEPSMRDCPHCKRSILYVAVRCRYCMSRSPAAGPA